MIKNLIQEAFILKTKGYYKHAIETFYRILELDNSSDELLLEIGECYYCLKDEERALSYIEQILEKNPIHINSLKLLKNIFVNKKAWNQAEQTAVNIYTITKNIKDLVVILELLNRQKKYKKVLEYDIPEYNPEILYQLATASLFTNDLEEAEAYINKALTEIQTVDFLVLKSKILYKMNRKDESYDLISSLEIDLNNADYLNFLGLVNQYKENYKEALRFFKEAIKISPEADEYYYNCASTYFKIQDMQYAKKYYNLAISKNPANPNYHFALANLYYSEKHYKRALEELDSDLFEAKLLKAIILYDTGYLTLAKKELNELSEKHPENPIISRYKAQIDEDLKI